MSFYADRKYLTEKIYDRFLKALSRTPDIYMSSQKPREQLTREERKKKALLEMDQITARKPSA